MFDVVPSAIRLVISSFCWTASLFIENLTCIYSVSYTHLDVYKRQPFTSRVQSLELLLQPVSFLSPVILYSFALDNTRVLTLTFLLVISSVWLHEPQYFSFLIPLIFICANYLHLITSYETMG